MEGVLSDPFALTLPSFSPALPSALRAHLDAAGGPGCAENHHALARQPRPNSKT
jgi:hypothetical protein